jgi:hypothetical protein
VWVWEHSECGQANSFQTSQKWLHWLVEPAATVQPVHWKREDCMFRWRVTGINIFWHTLYLPHLAIRTTGWAGPETVFMWVFVYAYMYRQNVIVHLQQNGILRFPNSGRKAIRHVSCSEPQYINPAIVSDLYPLSLLQQRSAPLQAQVDGRQKVTHHIALWQYNSHWIFTASSVFSFLQITKTTCPYSVFTLPIFNFFCSCEMGQDGSVGTADTDYELKGQGDRDSTAGRISSTFCSIYMGHNKAFVDKKRLNWLALVPLKAQVILKIWRPLCYQTLMLVLTTNMQTFFKGERKISARQIRKKDGTIQNNAWCFLLLQYC